MNAAELATEFGVPQTISREQVKAACRILGIDPGKAVTVQMTPHTVEIEARAMGARAEFLILIDGPPTPSLQTLSSPDL